MRRPHIVCECGEEFLFGEGFEKHAREAHGFITVYMASGGKKLVPILSHPAHSE